jgi:hypothetical protein
LGVARQLGLVGAVYRREDFAIVLGPGPGVQDGAVVFLSNAYRECQGAGRAERRERLTRPVASLAAAGGVPAGWLEVRGLLRPVLRAVMFGQGMAGLQAPLSRPALPYLAELVVVDQPTSIAYVTADQVREWGMPAAEVFETARANLARLAAGEVAGEQPAASGPALLRFVDDGDGYFVSRLLLDGWLAELARRVGGRPVAFVPDHNTVIVAGDEPQTLGRLFELVEKGYTEAVRPISPQAYTIDGHGALLRPGLAPPPRSRPTATRHTGGLTRRRIGQPATQRLCTRLETVPHRGQVAICDVVGARRVLLSVEVAGRRRGLPGVAASRVRRRGC